MTVAPFDLSGHVSLVTGANHGIGAATARRLSECGARVLIAYLRVEDEADPGIPEAYRLRRASDAEHVLAAIRSAGGQAIASEADLAEPAAAAGLFDIAEAELGPVDILVNNASGGCELRAVHHAAYPELPEEIQLLWYKDLRIEG